MSFAPVDALSRVIGPACASKFLIDYDFLDLPCLKLLLSKFLSIGIILGAVFVKVPQILNIVRSQSTKGLSPASYILENVGYLITLLYNVRNGYPFTTYGENFFLLLQGFILVFLFGFYNKKLNVTFVLGAAAFVGLAYYLYAVATIELMGIFQTATIPLFATSRLPQIYNNFVNKSTGVLSVITVIMNVAGTSARIFTTLQEVKDQVVLIGITSSWLLNTIILLQVLFYWKNSGATSVKDGKKAAADSGKSASKKKQSKKEQ